MKVLFHAINKKLLLAMIVIGFLSTTAIPLYAAQVTLAWDKPNDDRVVGYHIYSGKTGTDFKSTPNTTINSENTTTCTIANLDAGFEYSFAATSIDANGNESSFTSTITQFISPTDDTDDDGDGYTANQGDCNDLDAAIHPSATEICGDGIDQDCNGRDLTCTAGAGAKITVFGDTPDADLTGTVQDTYININNDVNVASDQLNTFTWPQDQPANAILIKFDLSQLPEGAQIQSATLTLYQTTAAGDATYDVSAHKIIGHNPDLDAANGYTFDGVNQWTANDNCYNSIPLAQADIAPAEDVNSLDLSLGYKNWNVTNMVQNWVDDSASNYGLMLNSDSAASSKSYRLFAASESVDAARRPSLEVVYSVTIDNDADGFTEDAGDCNDNDATIHPGAIEICGDGIDQDCNGSDLTCPEDIDDDQDGFTENQGDCMDDNPSVHPGAIDICGDGIDQDCNGSDLTCPEDIDDDQDGFTENQGDCMDNDPSVHPGATEICGDGIDQDCNGISENCDSEPQTVVFGDALDSDYPGTIQDTFININQDVNVASNQLNTFTWPKNTPANAVLLKIDLSQLPAQAQIQSAILTLYQTAAGGDATYDVSVHKIITVNPDIESANGYTYDGTNEWTSNDIAFKSIPLAQSDIAPTENVNSLDQSLGYKNWDVTAMVREWVSDPSTNYGLLLNSDAVANSKSYRFFAASESIEAAQRPILELTYTINNSDIDDDGDGFTDNEGDCNDNDGTIFPGAMEICGDGVDQDCNGVVDDCIAIPQTVVFGDTSTADYPGTVQDTFININQDVNVASNELNTFTWPENMPANAVLLKFDLSMLPVGAQIQSATLRLYQTAAGGDATYDVSVHKVQDVNPDLYFANGYTYDGINQWTANNACYNSIPLAQADISPTEDVNSLDQSLGYKEWKITSMVQDWVNDSATNYGLMLNSDPVASSKSYRFFAASEASADATRPELVVTYTETR